MLNLFPANCTWGRNHKFIWFHSTSFDYP